MPATFTSSVSAGPPRVIDETFNATVLPIPGTNPARFNTAAWTGTAADGTFESVAGSCKDWTSADRTLTGTYWSTVELRPFHADYHKRPCSALARLLCLSQ